MYYIIMRNQDGAWVTYGDEDFDTYEDAKYQLESLQEVDEMNGEHHEYMICEAHEIERVNREERMAEAVHRGYEKWKAEKPKRPEYKVTLITVGKEEEICNVDNETCAVAQARLAHAGCTPWESVEIKLNGQAIPYRVFVADRETGTVIEEVKGQYLLEAIDTAMGLINEYEAEDRAEGQYKEDYYDIINEFGESYIY